MILAFAAAVGGQRSEGYAKLETIVERDQSEPIAIDFERIQRRVGGPLGAAIRPCCAMLPETSITRITLAALRSRPAERFDPPGQIAFEDLHVFFLEIGDRIAGFVEDIEPQGDLARMIACRIGRVEIGFIDEFDRGCDRR